MNANQDTPGEVTPLQMAQIRVKLLASRVESLKHFKRILADVAPAIRKDVYNEIAPHLKFTPPPFWALKFPKVH